MNLNELKGLLTDFTQGASNAVASNVSGPVDLINSGLGYVGLPVSQKPFMGSAWMRERGLTADPQNKVAGLLGETAGMAGPILIANSAPKIASGLLTMAENAASPKTLNPQAGAIVWHGSPHKFDKFDASKIGSGEGAQAYGHGLYVAESPDVAAGYQKALSGYAADGKRLPSDIGTVVSDHGGDIGAAIATRQGQLDKWIATGADQKHFIVKGLQDDIKKLSTLQGKKLESTGALYKVDLPDDQIARMLDWDKPLSKQSPAVQKALQGQQMQDAIQKLHASGDLARYSADDMMKFTGEDYYDFLRQAHGDNNAIPSEYLKQQGIPGIRYLDGGSRGAGTGTSNFVVFPGNEDMLKILERNGQPIGLLGQ